MNIAALDQIVSKLSREQCLQILNAPGIDVAALQKAMAAVVASGAVVAPSAPVATATPKPAAKPATAPATPAPAAAKPTATGISAVDAINAIVGQGQGFSAGDVGTVCGLEARDSSIRTAIKNALAAKVIVSFGEKRFMRYGGTIEIATAASLKSQGKG